MNRRRAFTGIACAFLILQAAADGRGEELPLVSLSALVKIARTQNPEIKVAKERERMYASRIAQAGSLEDPMLMLKIQNGLVRDPLSFNQDPTTAKVIGISQAVPYFGKRALRSKLASADADAYRWLTQEKENELARMVKELYAQLFVTDRSLEVIERNISLVDDLIVLARTKYEVGQGTQQDVFKAEVERSRMFEMQISLRQRRAGLEARLNGLLNRPVGTSIGPVQEIVITPLSVSVGQLTAMALENRPQLQAQRALVRKGETNRQLAEKEWYPDAVISFEYMQRSAINSEMLNDPGYDMYSLGLTFNLPIQRERREAMRIEAAAETSMAAAEIESLTVAIDSGVADLVTQLDERRQLVELYRTGIIPQATQALEAATISYRVGKVDFLNLLESRNVLFGYERTLYEMQADYLMKLAQLEALIGTDLN